MTAFGIRTTEFFGGSTEHYIGEDAVLWDWLRETDYELSSNGSLYRVQAPEGYAFHQGNLFPLEDYGGGKNYAFVTMSSPEYEKVLMLLVSLRFVPPEEFTELDSDRILDIVLH